ncbi:GH92 family glycosyl hydrolase [Tamlana sp. 2201CG12-4]|uniref:GH92 family glycosyl hydrolase n=1 Tax=Tamlana sp. 2201CG12-4 TaxID=3112582 RepID=UPI002DBDA6DF|nr:GH92 family glycosyl hydrolase [Tamlana sp. 2201CG12-4]MEC3908248.1 GH92 family glycosyl hydrolase [Tamlana sp. 2201CG12-4]
MLILKKAIKQLVFTVIVITSNLICAQELIDYVNPFVGTSNFGATNPGAIAPRGMASVSPFNVAGPQNLPHEKDSRWLSNPYVHENTFLTGFSHVNLSGVGCPDLGVILAMPTTGDLQTNHLKYGSTYKNEIARPGYYSVALDKYKVKAEVTATERVGISRYTFPKGQSNILINLGLGLTNESGAMIKVVSPTEIEGIRNVGSFCYYKPEEAYPVYFVAKFSHPADEFGIWKTPEKSKGVEAQWMSYNGKTRLFKGYKREVIGDSIGSYFTYHFKEPTQVEMKVGISYVSIENARENLEKETQSHSFETIHENTASRWNDLLSKVEVEGGTRDDKTIFYTALYHTLIHPNILNDINGEYPSMAKRETMKTEDTRYTVFSLWDTYRNLHALMSLIYPKQQSDMVKSMLNIYDESGWLPKWELNATETTTMVGDPAGVILADTYLRGIQDFDIEKAYEAMRKSALQLEDNPLRPGIKDYIDKGYLTTTTTKSGSVSTTQEYNITDFAIAQLAKQLNKKEDYNMFSKRSVSYRNLFDKTFNLLRPKNHDGSWYMPFNPDKGANFEKNLGFIEGNSWQYTFMVSHDVKTLMKLMGGKKAFVNQLDKVFEIGQYDMANEPDINYPFLYNYAKGYERKTQDRVSQLINQYFKNTPDGLPGNDDTGTMSAWLIYSMMGIYPVSPAEPIYAITKPAFNKITIHLDKRYYKNDTLEIISNISENNENNKKYIDKIRINDNLLKSYFITHKALVNGTVLNISLK